jgi:hypothetical protein
MNTELRNVASVVSVFTPEFMPDLGATTIQDLMDYGLNTLNVRDLFEQNEQSARRFRPVGPEGTPVITRYNVFPPRSWRLTAGLDF